jgi:hypothetical protein
MENHLNAEKAVEQFIIRTVAEFMAQNMESHAWVWNEAATIANAAIDPHSDTYRIEALEVKKMYGIAHAYEKRARALRDQNHPMSRGRYAKPQL